MAAAVVESSAAAKVMSGELQFSPGSHLGSSFIDSLRKKYPKACNRSLTNLSLPSDASGSRSQLSLAKGQGGDNLSAFHRGLSSSQPDLMKASGLAFNARPLGMDVDAPLGPRTASVSGLHLLLQKKSQLQTSRSSLTSLAVEQRLRESKAKMNEIASKITEISRSNTSLVNVGQEMGRLTLAPQLSDDDVDDTAPVCAEIPAAVDVAAIRDSTPSKRLSSSEAKAKLEEIRLKLTQKCEQLQQRREKLFAKINSRRQEETALDSTATSVKVVTETPVAAPMASIVPSVTMPTTSHRKSGTDSDGDSGIDLSMRRSRPKNSHIPKLKKFGKSVQKGDNSHLVFDASGHKHNVTGRLSDVISEVTETVDCKEGDGELTSQPPAALPASQSEPPRDLQEEDNSHSKEPPTSKSVRFSHSPDVIESKTPRLLELQRLAEEAAAASFEEEECLPDTSLAGFDSESSEGSCSGDSDTDLSDVDPRLAQLALGFSKPSLKSVDNHEQSPPPSSAVESPPTSHTPSNKNSSTENTASVVENAEPLKGPVKAPRTFTSELPEAEATSASELSLDEKRMPEDQPYSVVDVAAFSPDKKVKRDSSSRKPPLPKSKPPQSASHKSNSAADNTPPVKDANSRRSHLGRKDFEPPYSYTSDRPQSASENGHSDCDTYVAGTDKKNCSPVSSNTNKSTSASNAPAHFSKPPSDSARRTGSCNDLWGSNASLYSSNEHLGSNNSLSESRSSLFERVGSFKQAAKKKMKSLKRSLSLEKLSGSKSNGSEFPPPKPLSKKTAKDGVPTIKPSLSWKSLNQLKLSKKGSYTTKSGETGAGRPKDSPKKSVVDVAAGSVDEPNHFRRIGKLLELCADGCKRVQLNRPPHGPFGFYIGPSEHRPGVFITRLSDSYAEKLFSGLLAVGDEIKEVNNVHVSKLSQSDILDMISKGQKVILKVKSAGTVTSELWF